MLSAQTFPSQCASCAIFGAVSSSSRCCWRRHFRHSAPVARFLVLSVAPVGAVGADISVRVRQFAHFLVKSGAPVRAVGADIPVRVRQFARFLVPSVAPVGAVGAFLPYPPPQAGGEGRREWAGKGVNFRKKQCFLGSAHAWGGFRIRGAHAWGGFRRTRLLVFQLPQSFRGCACTPGGGLGGPKPPPGVHQKMLIFVKNMKNFQLAAHAWGGLSPRQACSQPAS